MFPQVLSAPRPEVEQPQPRREHVARPGMYENPLNGYREVGGTPLSWLWCLLFGFFYLAIKGAWAHAAIGLVLAIITFGWSWLIYPFFARAIVDASYLRRGWRPVTDGEATAQPEPKPQSWQEEMVSRTAKPYRQS